MKQWDELVRAATLGTERAEPAVSPAGGALDALLEQLVGEGREAGLLKRAALVDGFRILGTRPGRLEGETPAPAPAEGRPQVPARAAARLRAFFTGPRSDALLGEWLSLAARAGRIAPPDCLPDLLDLAAAHKPWRLRVAPVLGERGHWLARQNPDWRAIEGRELSWEDWAGAGLDARCEFLRAHRHEEGARCLELVRACWSESAAAERRRLLETLDVGLSEADAPFLESCLADRSQGVRELACQLLCRLPGPIGEQVLSAAHAWLAITSSGQLEVRLPERFDPAWGPFGLQEKKPAGQPMGQKSWWLQQLISRHGPSVHARRLHLGLEELLALADRHEEAELLRRGLEAGARAQADAPALEALLARAKRDHWSRLFAEYAPLLAPDRRQSALIGYLKNHGRIRSWWELQSIASAFDGEWPFDLASQVISQTLPELLAGYPDSGTRPALEQLALRLPAEARDALDRTVQRACADGVPPSVAEGLAVFDIRIQMREEFRE